MSAPNQAGCQILTKAGMGNTVDSSEILFWVQVKISNIYTNFTKDWWKIILDVLYAPNIIHIVHHFPGTFRVKTRKVFKNIHVWCQPSIKKKNAKSIHFEHYPWTAHVYSCLRQLASWFAKSIHFKLIFQFDRQQSQIRLMEEIPNNHLRCNRPVINNVISYISTGAGCLPATVWRIFWLQTYFLRHTKERHHLCVCARCLCPRGTLASPALCVWPSTRTRAFSGAAVFFRRDEKRIVAWLWWVCKPLLSG